MKKENKNWKQKFCSNWNLGLCYAYQTAKIIFLMFGYVMCPQLWWKRNKYTMDWKVISMWLWAIYRSFVPDGLWSPKLSNICALYSKTLREKKKEEFWHKIRRRQLKQCKPKHTNERAPECKSSTNNNMTAHNLETLSVAILLAFGCHCVQCSTMTCFQQQFVTVNSVHCYSIAHVSILFLVQFVHFPLTLFLRNRLCWTSFSLLCHFSWPFFSYWIV